MPGMNEHVRLNRQAWDTESELYQQEHWEDLETDEIYWAEALSAESDLKLLGKVEGRMVLELGCGAGQASMVLAKRGAWCVGVDVSLSQLKHGLTLQKRNGLSVPTVLSDVENSLPFTDRAFDLVFCVFGAIGFIDCKDCFHEVFRVLKPGGLFVFSWYHPFMSCFPGSGANQLEFVRSYFDRSPMVERKSTEAGTDVCYVEYHRTVGDWYAQITGAGFRVLEIIEPSVSKGDGWRGSTFPNVPRYKVEMIPSTMIWKAQKPAAI